MNLLSALRGRLQRHQHTGQDGSMTLGTGVVTMAMLANGVDATSYTPAITGAGTAGTLTYTRQVGRYARIGPYVVFQFVLLIDTITVAPTGNVTINLPVATANISNLFQTVPMTFSTVDLSAGYTQMAGLASVNSTVLTVYQLGDDVSNSAVQGSALATGDQLTGGGIYFVA